ncbi:putative small G-protein Ras2 [Xylariaceae sp. AK1471]|nr:putative small G-protein Ras2 [Xylariaceae sp. AK1471]
MQLDPSLCRVAVLGDGGVGKTALTIQLCFKRFVGEYDPTIEDSYRTQATINDQTYTLEVLDTAGQEDYRNLQDNWIRQCDGIVLVYSVTSRSSFTKIDDLFRQVLLVKDWNPKNAAAQPPARLPIMIVGNKSDEVTERIVSVQEGHALAKELRCMFTETSAKHGKNVEKAFYDVVKVLPPKMSDNAASWEILRGGCSNGWCIIM